MRLAVASNRTLIRGLLVETLRTRCGAEHIVEFDSPEALAAGASQLADTPVLVIDTISIDTWTGSLEEARRAAPACRFVVMTAAEGDYVSARATAGGPVSFVHELDSVDELVAAVQSAQRGGCFMSPAAFGKRAKPAVMALLSWRELEVFRLACKGVSDDDAGKALQLSPSTVESHRTNVLRKLSISDWAELLVLGLRLGVVSLQEIQFMPRRRRSAARRRRR